MMMFFDGRVFVYPELMCNAIERRIHPSSLSLSLSFPFLTSLAKSDKNIFRKGTLFFAKRRHYI